MKKLLRKLESGLFLLKTGQFCALCDALWRQLYSKSVSIGLRRDLNTAFEAPPAKIPVTIRRLEDADIPKLFDMNAPDITRRSAYLLKKRQRFLRENLPTCYVAVTEDNEPCFMQWLIAPTENDKIQAYFDGLYPPLKPNEALLEYGYTLDAYQRKGIMPYGLARIAEKAQDFGARWVMTYVEHQNIPSLKGCKRAGFVPYLELTRTRVLFWQQITHTPLPEGTPFPFD